MGIAPFQFRERTKIPHRRNEIDNFPCIASLKTKWRWIGSGTRSMPYQAICACFCPSPQQSFFTYLCSRRSLSRVKRVNISAPILVANITTDQTIELAFHMHQDMPPRARAPTMTMTIKGFSFIVMHARCPFFTCSISHENRPSLNGC